MMVKLFKIIIALIILYFLAGYLFGGEKVLNFIDYYSSVFIDYIKKNVSLIAEYMSNKNITLSTILTVLLITVVALYILHISIDLIRKLFFSMAGKSHRPLRSKHKIKKAMHSLLIIKGILFAFKLILLFAQAWSLGKFLNFIIEQPKNLLDLIKSDAIFLLVLSVLLLSFIFKRKSSDNEEYNYQTIN